MIWNMGHFNSFYMSPLIGFVWFSYSFVDLNVNGETNDYPTVLVSCPSLGFKVSWQPNKSHLAQHVGRKLEIYVFIGLGENNGKTWKNPIKIHDLGGFPPIFEN